MSTERAGPPTGPQNEATSLEYHTARLTACFCHARRWGRWGPC